uniref:Reverse transcriptase domain-containing protein n=1 Tax=Myotis myotis TaxID=51298 RepID=A0A7J7YDU1_MYOMY|nr:hypothetical protein mMyoMyo1_011109 [Myotis myotis]
MDRGNKHVPFTHSLPKPTHEETENLKRPVTSKEIGSVIKDFLIKNSSGPDGFIGEFKQTFEELKPILLKLFQKIEEEETLPNSLYEASIILIPKPDKDSTRKLQTRISDEHGCKNPQQNTSKLISTVY